MPEFLPGDTTPAFSRPVLLVDTLSATNDYAVELALALAAVVRLTVFTIETTSLRDGPAMKILPYFPRYGGGATRLAKSMAALRGTVALTRALWRHRRGVVHVQFMRFPRVEWFVYLLLRPWLACLVITVHNALPHERRPWHRAFYGSWYRRADRIHVLSANVGRQLTETMGISATRMDIIPHGDYRRFMARNQPAVELSMFGVPALFDPARVVVGFFGLIRPYKGLASLARAFAMVTSRRATLLVAGKIESSATAEMVEVAASLAGDDRYHLLPRFLDDHELAALLTRADILVFPYTDISQSGALMLALTYGKAVIANDIGGFREYLHEGETGLLCDTGDARVFAATLTRLIDDKELRERLSQNAQREMHSRFGWGTIASSLVNCYRHALAAREPADRV